MNVVRFFSRLMQYGTDFTLIAQLFPSRTRKQIKSKFKNEERTVCDVVVVVCFLL